MTKLKIALLIVTALAAPLFSGEAKAVVVTYTLTFHDPDGADKPLTGGSGLMTLDVLGIPGTLNIGTGSPQFVGLTATINGESFAITDIWSIGFTAGVLNNLSAQSPTNWNSPGSHYLQVSGTDFFRVGTVNAGDFISSGTFSIGGPVIQAAVPELSTWAMMLLGFAGIAFIARQRQSKRSIRPA